MAETDDARPTPPSLKIQVQESGQTAIASGTWNLRGLAVAPRLQTDALGYANRAGLTWDLRGIDALDSAGTAIFWEAWGGAVPPGVLMRPEHERLFDRWQERQYPTALKAAQLTLWPVRLAKAALSLFQQLLTVLTLLGQLVLDLMHLLRHPRQIPWKEISATLHETGGRALGITALVGFLIGIVVSYLSSLQLRTFGASVYIVNILGLSIIRELGPLLAAILVAGRSGSSMTARLGVMRVTQELDALAAMGISRSLRLILPKVVALTIAMPLLVVWTDVIALIGGAISANIELGISVAQFALKLPNVVPVMNFYIGLLKGAVFGLAIALVACHFGLRIRPDTESLGNETTNSVVAAITLVILLDAVFAIMFRGVGLR
ncbi:MAG: putative transporter, permease protein [Proteobacteria bacterium]|nr:putative transporter, permease protein [Pseudomonadota bacterium]